MNRRDLLELPRFLWRSKTIAGLAHLAILLSWVGIVGAFLVWFFNRRSRPSVAFQGFQAGVYQFAYHIVLVGLWGVVVNITDADAAGLSMMNDGIISGMEMTLFGINAVGRVVLWLCVMYAVLGAVMCFLGRDFRYVFLGRFLEKRVGRVLPFE